MTESQVNTRERVERFFEQLGSETELISYKNAVPFVHIPDELFAQWESFSRIKQDWFREIWTSREWGALTSFDTFFRSRLRATPKSEKDLNVPEILRTKIWKEIMEKANEMRVEMAGPSKA